MEGGLTLDGRLTRIETSITELSGQVTALGVLAGRYTPEEVARYQRWREEVDSRLTGLERRAAVGEELASWKRWQIGQTAGIVAALAGVAGVLVAVLVHH